MRYEYIFLENIKSIFVVLNIVIKTILTASIYYIIFYICLWGDGFNVRTNDEYALADRNGKLSFT